MNFLLINYEFPPVGGGAGNATHFMGKALVELGHEVHILTCAWEDDEGYRNLDGIHLHRIPSKRSHPSMASSWEKISFVAKAFSYLKTIVKQGHITHAIVFFTIPNGPLGWWLNKKHDIPYILSLRGGDVPGLVPEIDHIHKVITPIRRSCLKRSHAIVANAEGLAQLSRDADPYAVDVIPNGVDTETFKPAVERRSSPTFDVVFVGRFHPQKNLPPLFKTIAKMKQAEGRPLRLHMVGEGPEETALRQLQEQLSLDEEIFWHGWTQKKDLIHLHQRCSVMVNPSHYEGLPNAVLEGMASGLAIVVSDVPGNNDLVTDECGLSFPISETEKLFLALQDLRLRNEEDVWQLGDASRRRVQEHYSWASTAQQYVDRFNAQPKSSL